MIDIDHKRDLSRGRIVVALVLGITLAGLTDEVVGMFALAINALIWMGVYFTKTASLRELSITTKDR